MKKVMKSNLFLLMVLSALFTGFTACGGDDEPTPGPDYANAVVGTYNGDLTAPGTTLGTDVKIVVTKVSNTSVMLSLTNASIMDQDFNISCNATINSDYEVTGTTVWGVIPVTISGDFWDNDESGKITSIHLNIGLTGLPIENVTYEGDIVQ